jgi:hypothetical protein
MNLKSDQKYENDHPNTHNFRYNFEERETPPKNLFYHPSLQRENNPPKYKKDQPSNITSRSNTPITTRETKYNDVFNLIIDRLFKNK